MPVPFTLRQLEYFDAIATEGSIASASAKCHVSASALALALDDLEARLGLQLVIRRKGKGIELAPAGARLLAHARQLLAGRRVVRRRSVAERHRIERPFRRRLLPYPRAVLPSGRHRWISPQPRRSRAGVRRSNCARAARASAAGTNRHRAALQRGCGTHARLSSRFATSGPTSSSQRTTRSPIVVLWRWRSWHAAAHSVGYAAQPGEHRADVRSRSAGAQRPLHDNEL